ncbi:uncharacterized protein LOC126892532 [Diabrotica virgifera virgifera]|uniref:THAP-type domain-containing protein n=1 Tax=Diabrotica virgifera virgifera TaxID=50390 RepID=A0ABM5L6I5_DIAVI|nr:uncharacterized protein LOC126887051 [Diabrotica virgifera virgifera]XP_050518047.1 uncharacterized protein LOC126892532 [Diabrotica virgifera virgifera]
MEATQNQYYKYCIVHLCSNTTYKTPGKLFIRVPKDQKRRLKWLKACRKNEKDISQKTTAHVCEDHFNLEEDIDNYVKYKLMGGPKKMKPNVVPHIFDCQQSRKRSFENHPRAAGTKRTAKRIVDEAISLVPQDPVCIQENLGIVACSSKTIHPMEIQLETKNDIEVSKRDVSSQTRPSVRTKGVQCNLHCGITVALSPIRIIPDNIEMKPSTSYVTNISETTLSIQSSGHENFSESVSGSSEYTLTPGEVKKLNDEKRTEFKNLTMNCTITKLQNRPRLYMGLPEHAYYTFQLLEKYCTVNSMYIFLTLKKIRTGLSFLALADDFGITESYASKIFSKSVPIISKYLRKCIIQPQVSFVKSNLPIAFRARYCNIYCIIDCLEIEIEKPTDAVKQSLTWSEYKKCNTLKYLICCTPDGIINYISTAFGGRTSDAIIAEHSGFLNILPSNVAVMADRGFKHIDHLLRSKGCVLIRPPSVSVGTKPSKDEVFETKRIASLRIHVERVIRRLREFSFLAPHACIDNKLLCYSDNIIKIVCGLINLQSGIISGR